MPRPGLFDRPRTSFADARHYEFRCHFGGSQAPKQRGGPIARRIFLGHCHSWTRGVNAGQTFSAAIFCAFLTRLRKSEANSWYISWVSRKPWVVLVTTLGMLGTRHIGTWHCCEPEGKELWL